jgi:23S rRNA U2552 (ribose-2'-O)-methylase RlmE/FtsJ
MGVLQQKYVVCIEEEKGESENDGGSTLSLNRNINDKLRDILMIYKNMITHYYNNKSWDKFKKITNEYEYIYSSSSCELNVCNYVPISRSFFKLWEMLHDHKNDMFPEDRAGSPMNCVFLCEGPGGFAESVVRFRNNRHDDYYGMTLKCDSNRMVPEWKVPHGNINITYGADGTGNIYNVDNIKYIAKVMGKKNAADFITGDGGFDFSSDFNNQEDMCFKLLASEILAALYLQRPGGCFVLKVFDVFSERTIRLIHVLHKVYDKVIITKPLTSRPANSEKYLVCVNFKNTIGLSKLRDQLETCIKTDDHNSIQIPMSSEVLHQIVSYNSYIVLRQVHYIQNTIRLIKSPSCADRAGIAKNNLGLCRDWCKQYDLV